MEFFCEFSETILKCAVLHDESRSVFVEDALYASKLQVDEFNSCIGFIRKRVEDVGVENEERHNGKW